MRIFILGVELLVIVAVSLWLVTQPGSIVIEWGEYHVDRSLAFSFLVLTGAFLLLTFVVKIWRFIVLLPSRMYAYSQKLRPEKGLQALTQSIVATALEEYDQAKNDAYRFERYLGENAVYKGLIAFNNCAQQQWDEARKICETMKAEPDSKTLSWIIEARVAIAEGRDIIALSCLQNLYQLHEKSPWVLRELLRCSLKLKMYDISLDVLKKAERASVLPLSMIKKTRAVIFYHQAEKETISLEQKENLLEGAHRLAPELVKISVQYSKVLRLLDKGKRSKKVIEQSWTVQPHSDLLEEYMAIEHDTDPKTMMKTAAKLISYNEQHPESYLAIARFALKMQEWGRARAALHDFQEKHEMTAQACYLMARLELSQHADQTRYREWMERAYSAIKLDNTEMDIENVIELT